MKSIEGYMKPCPKLAGMRYTWYFQPRSSNANSAIRPLPMAMRNAPRRIIGISLPQRDMMIPASREPIGVPSEGIIRRAPALAADSSKMTWKKSGVMNKNYFLVSHVIFEESVLPYAVSGHAGANIGHLRSNRQ